MVGGVELVVEEKGRRAFAKAFLTAFCRLQPSILLVNVRFFFFLDGSTRFNSTAVFLPFLSLGGWTEWM